LGMIFITIFGRNFYTGMRIFDWPSHASVYVFAAGLEQINSAPQLLG
jgi:hypothetical protein